MTTAKKLIDEVLKSNERDFLPYLGLQSHKLARMLQKAIEQRDRYFPGQHHGLGYSIEQDNAELDRIANREDGE